MDETFLSLYPGTTRGWAAMSGEDRVRFLLGAMDKRCVTCSVLTCQWHGALSVQLISAGKTDAVLPAASVELSRSETHWATADKILELLAWHQEGVVPECTPWMSVWDAAPIHVSAETCAPSRRSCRASHCAMCQLARTAGSNHWILR